MHVLIPHFNAAERILSNMLASRLTRCSDPSERLRLRNLQAELELEVAMIHMNLGHLFRRYAEELVDALDDPEGKGGAMLALDEHEAVAIESIRRLYQRTQELDGIQ
ncbi:hypothetical protein [Billgrantia lactosivorans]|uniref:hypothetical protein n=1 Tax=Billgrantia lactosivorans TaxID=2185141 RepID=UPI000DAD096B|nr:hypothetical protein [Halomonas lactosivorans]